MDAPAQQFLFESQRSMLPPRRWNTTWVQFKDINRDGNPDALLLGNSQPKLWLNQGFGSYADHSDQLGTLGQPVVTAINAADVDGDGDIDIYLATTGPDLLLENLGNGVFRERPGALPVESEWPRCVAMGDLDGDGDIDILLGFTFGSLTARILQNDGTGQFTEFPQGLPATSQVDTRALVLADLDRDGDLDVLMAGNPATSYWTNDGTGTFRDARALLPSAVPHSRDVATIDADRDGDLDFFLIESSSMYRRPRLFLNDGTGRFVEAGSGSLPSGFESYTAVSIADVDGDGDEDALLLGDSQHDLLLRNDGTGSFQSDPSAIPRAGINSRDADWSDVDGDGDIDVLIASSTYQNRLLLNDGRGQFRDGDAWPTFATDESWVESVALDDLDNDGDADLILGYAGTPSVYANDGTGGFERWSIPFPRNRSSRTIAIGDYDSDGDRDLAFGGTTWPWVLMLNSGNGSFVDASSRIAASPSTYDHAGIAGDFDGDGDLDLVAGTGGSFDFLTNDGSARFTSDLSRFPSPQSHGSCPAAADVDGDGDLDLAAGYGESCCGPATVPLRLFLNRGNGFFDLDTRFPSQPIYAKALCFADVDGDGDLDLFAATTATQPHRLYLNDGSGGFADASHQMPANRGSGLAVAAADIDADGDVDVIFGNGAFGVGDHPDFLYLNHGDGTFADASARYSGLDDSTNGLAIADIDGDADLDVISGMWHQLRQLSNRSQQLAWSALPRIGKDLVLGLDGPIGSPFCLACAPRSGTWALPPIGDLRLDPAVLWIFGEGVLDAAGESSVRLAVPREPMLLNVPVYFQAIVGVPPRLTNLEIARATAW